MKKAMKQSVLVAVLNTVSILLLVGVAVSVFLFVNFNKQIEKANTDRFDLTYNANRFMNGSANLTNAVRAYAATADQTYYDAYMTEVNELKNRETGVANLREIGITEDEEAMISEMSALSDDLVPLEEKAMTAAAAGRVQEAQVYVFSEKYMTAVDQINQLKTKFLEALDTRTAGEVQKLSVMCTLMKWVVYVFLLLSVAIQLVQVCIVKRKVIRPVLHIRDEMLELSRGNLSTVFRLEADSSEIGMLVDAIHKTKSELKKYIGDISFHLEEMSKGNMSLSMYCDYIGDFKPIRQSLNIILDSMNRTIRGIDDVAAQVSAHSEQVSDGAQALAQGATQQASSVQELAATVQELTNRMAEIAKNAGQARTLTSQAADSLELGDEKMQEMQRSMKDIAEASEAISKIIKTIDDIAFQTNILALNAAVEAARAGAAGKGFAVVADEVRNLANKSSEASKQTTLLIQQSTQAVEQGVALAEDTARTLNTAVEQARRSTGYVDSIATDSEDQAGALHQISVGVDQISAVVQTNSATAQQSAAASQELNNRAGQLKEQIAVFQLRDQAPALDETARLTAARGAGEGQAEYAHAYRS